MSKWIEFHEIPASGVTRVFTVASKQGAALGTVKWFSHWRRYTFEPYPGTTFDVACLTEIAQYLSYLMEDYNAKRR